MWLQDNTNKQFVVPNLSNIILMCLFNEFEANRVGIRKKFLNAEHLHAFDPTTNITAFLLRKLLQLSK
ncbi:hypothetical protein BpHYR1_053432 [Brachionus plicatilis]|uniref:Uncharacterized protein n=1 Tax=Brachionus plicatilis TaxID=10195 RepID=A0A3M7QHN1_BRAPC|nr:hypothetical protein BpHYR1_053432 [Brachionus plicatilis]